MADSYKMFYFDSWGRGELIRLVFAKAGVDYEDVRVTFDQWKNLKPKLKFNFLPILEMNGRELEGSVVIARYLAEKFGLAGTNEWENAEIAGVVDYLDYMARIIGDAYYYKKESRNMELEKNIPQYLGKLNELALNNNGFLWGGKLTWADLYAHQIIQWLEDKTSDILVPYPHVSKVKMNVEKDPNIAVWLKNRPKANF